MTVFYDNWDALPNWTIPLTTHSVAGRKAVELVSHRAPEQDASSPTAPSGWMTKLSFNGVVHQPGIAIYTKELTGAETDIARSFTEDGSAAVIIFDGALDLANAAVQQNHSDTVSHGSGFVIVGLVTNSVGTIGAPSGAGWTEIGTYAAQYSGGRYFYNESATAGSTTFTDIGTQRTTFSLTLPGVATAPSDPLDLTIGTVTSPNSQIGTGIGNQIGSVDNNGVSAPSGGEINFTAPITANDGNIDQMTFYTDVQVPGVPAGEGYEFFATTMDGGSTIEGPKSMGKIISGAPKTTLSTVISGGGRSNLSVVVRGVHGLEEILVPPTTTNSLFGTWGMHQIIDWWEWSLNPANGDLFGIAARATGGSEFWCHANTATGDGSQNAPWSPAQLKGMLDNRSLPANSRVNMGPGDYNNKGLAGGENQVIGGGGGGGWVTLVGPNADQGQATLDCTTDTRGWSMSGTASKIQYVRLRTKNTGMHAAFTSYVNGGGTRVGAGQGGDPTMRQRLGGYNPAGIGFQLDGFPSGGRPGPVVWVNCVSENWGENFGTFQSGNALAVGCVGSGAAWASPNGRSNMSFSWFNGGKATTPGQEDLVTSGGNSYYGGAFGCLMYHAFQLHPSSGIDDGSNDASNHITDGNGFIFPTDGFDSPQGRFFRQANIAYGHGGIGFNSFEGALDGVDTSNNTSFQNGYNAAHRAGTNPLNLPIGLVVGITKGDGAAYTEQRYQAGTYNPRVYNNIGIASAYDSRSFLAWVNTNVTGDGNVWSSTPVIEFGAVGSAGGVVSGAQIINSSSVVASLADAHLPASSPARGAGILAEAIFPIDMMGQPLIDRGGGTCDAGALQFA